MKIPLFSILLAASLLGCGGDDSGSTCGPGTVLKDGQCVSEGGGLTCGPGTVEDNGTCVPTTTPTSFVQVEHLARPGINEALLLSDGFLTGYNATAPTFDGVPPDVLDKVVAEAKTVLKAIYLGTCFLNGVAGLSPQQGLHPAGMECHAVGGAIVEADGETQTAASITASQAYADAVFGYFIPDVMRVDTSAASAYLTPCGSGPVLLCGGRFVRDDVIDVTYDFLLNGAATCADPATCQAPNQFNALVSDGVVYDTSDPGGGGSTSRHRGDPTNKQQGHPAVSNSFPYSAAPF